jgi:UrcA family protein
MSRNLIALALLSASTLTTPAWAEKQVWRTGEGITIVTADLDLSRVEGRAALLRRVEFAGREVCRGLVTRRTLARCIDESVARAMTLSPPMLRRAVETARLEREGSELAAR